MADGITPGSVAAARKAVQEGVAEEMEAEMKRDPLAVPSSSEGEVCRLCETRVAMKDFSEHAIACLVGSSCANSIAVLDEGLERLVDELDRTLYVSCSQVLSRYSLPPRDVDEGEVKEGKNDEIILSEVEVPPTRSFAKLCRDALKSPEFSRTSQRTLRDIFGRAEGLYQTHEGDLRPLVKAIWKQLLTCLKLKLAHLTSGFSACAGLSVDPETFFSSSGTPPVNPKSWQFQVASRAFGLSVGEPHLSDFELLKPIKGGAFGLVFLAKHIKTGDYCAVKVLKKTHVSLKNQRERVSSEQAILAQTANPWIVKMYYSFESKDHLFIVMEYLPGGDCLSFLERFGVFEERLAKQYLAETVLALEYLHSQGIIHRDLKPDNMLINKDGHIKLTDFGLSTSGLEEVSGPMKSGAWQDSMARAVKASEARKSPAKGSVAPTAVTRRSIDFGRASSRGSSSSGDSNAPSSSSPALPAGVAPKTRREKAYSCVGTPDYLAPEVVKAQGHDAGVDFWALGVVMYEFLTGEPPFAEDTQELVFRRILNDNELYYDEEDEISEVAKDLISQLLIKDPSKRMGNREGGIQEIKDHPFFADIDWDKLHDRQALFEPKPRNVEDTSYFGPDTKGNASAEIGIGELLTEQQQGPSSMARIRSLPGLESHGANSPAFAFRNVVHLAEMNQAVLNQAKHS